MPSLPVEASAINASRPYGRFKSSNRVEVEASTVQYQEDTTDSVKGSLIEFWSTRG